MRRRVLVAKYDLSSVFFILGLGLGIGQGLFPLVHQVGRGAFDVAGGESVDHAGKNLL